MAQLSVDGEDLRIALSLKEKLATFHGDLRVPLRAVRRIRTPTDPWSILRGWRATGFAFPGYAAMGKRRHGTGYDFTLVFKERPTVLLECNGAEFGEVIVSVDDALTTAGWIAQAAGISFDPAT